MKAAILTIGTEILIGQTIDTNAAWLGTQLNDLGITIVKTLSISDTHEMIESSIKTLSSEADLLIITGGLGPTQDDITKLAIASLLDVEMVYDSSQYERIEAYFKHSKRIISDLHKQQCYFPKGVELLENGMGTAPGILWEYNNCKIINTPGVPYEMKYIIEHHVLPLVAQTIRSTYTMKTLYVAGLPESTIADKIDHIISKMPKHQDVAYLPSLGVVKIRLSSFSADSSTTIPATVEKIKDTLGNYLLQDDETSLVLSIKNLMEARGYKLGLAESCTGGYTSQLLTNLPGVSSFYEGSIVAYSYEIKNKLLNVNLETLENHGAVSEETVREMLHGCIDNLGVDVGIAISGIAGPGGGTPEKPVGTIWVCVGNKQRAIAKNLNFNRNREINIKYTANAALIMLRRFLLTDQS